MRPVENPGHDDGGRALAMTIALVGRVRDRQYLIRPSYLKGQLYSDSDTGVEVVLTIGPPFCSQ